MTKSELVRRAVAVCIAVTVVAGCDEGDELIGTESLPPVSVAVSPASVDMFVGESRVILALVVGGSSKAGRSVTWTSSNPGVATATGTEIGTVVGTSPGTATLTAKTVADPTVQATASVRVRGRHVITVTPNPVALLIGETAKLSAAAKTYDGEALEDPGFAYASDDETVATVSSDGVVTGVSEGSTDVRVTLAGPGGGTVLVPVTVTAPPPAGPVCGVSGTENVTVAVKSDPNGHAPYVNMPGALPLSTTVAPDGSVITIGGPAPFIQATGALNADCVFDITGTGSAAGYGGVRARITGQYVDGQPFVWTYVVGENATLPNGAIEYTLTKN